MQPRNMLDIATEAIKAGDIDALTNALEATYTTQEEYTYWAPPPGYWTYELGIPDDIEHTETRDVEKKYIDITRDGRQLLITAAETNRPEIIIFLIDKYHVKVTPQLMKEFLNTFTTNLLPNYIKFQIAGYTVSDLQDRVFPNPYDIALIMFKNYLRNELNHGTAKSVLNIIKNVEKYLPPNSPQLQSFMLSSKILIFAYGTGSLIKALDTIFNFSTDNKFLQDMNKWFEQDTWNRVDRSDVVKDAFIHEHLSTQETADSINDKYNNLIKQTVADIEDIVTDTQTRSGSLFFSKSRAIMSLELISAVRAVNMDETTSSVEKIKQIATLLADTYNQICDKVNNSKTQFKSETANQLLETLITLCYHARIDLNHTTHPKDRRALIPVKLNISERLLAEDRIVQKFNEKPVNAPNKGNH